MANNLYPPGSSPTTLPPLSLPEGITESYITTSDLTYHVLSAGDSSAPLILLLHGFPELAYSYRKIILPLSRLSTGPYHVVAYDARGYGRTTGWDTSPFDTVKLDQFSMSRLTTDAICLARALGHTSVHCLIGHDFGAVSASWCAVMRPDFFKSVVLMSHPFKGTTTFPLQPSDPSQPPKKDTIHKDLATLPEPRKAYKWYYSTAAANNDLLKSREGLFSFLRGYFYLKSADWPGNNPHKLSAWDAESVAQMPYYYVMPLSATMPEAVSLHMASESSSTVASKSSRWLPDNELAVYEAEFSRTGFQGGLNWYRRVTEPEGMRDTELFAGRKIQISTIFICGAKDWGMYQEPGAVENIGSTVGDGLFAGVKVVDRAGHWVMQERPEDVVALVEEFLKGYMS